MSSFSAYPPDTRGGQILPLTSWEGISRLFTEHLEFRRFQQLPASKRSSNWKERRKRGPCSEAVPQSGTWMPSISVTWIRERTANAFGD
jgi:hypothetical protein